MLAAWTHCWLPVCLPLNDFLLPPVKFSDTDAGRMKADSSSSLCLPAQGGARPWSCFPYRTRSLAREEVSTLILLLFFWCDIFTSYKIVYALWTSD